MRSLVRLFALGLWAVPAAAQTAPPIHGVTGTVATDATIKSEHEAAHKIGEGVGKVLPGGKAALRNPLDGFTEGRRVVLKDANETTEGVVIDVNRRKQQITIRITPKKTETLRVAQPGGTPGVTVSFTGPAGTTVTRDFSKVS